jgi:hypothetical protein
MPLIETSRAATNLPPRGKKLKPVMREFAVIIRLKTWTSLFCGIIASKMCQCLHVMPPAHVCNFCRGGALQSLDEI